MEDIANAMGRLAEAIHALARAVAPPPVEPTDPFLHEVTVQRAPKARKKPGPKPKLKPAPASVRIHHFPVRPYRSWPAWGTEHTMTCRKRGCHVCARLAKTNHEEVVA